MNYIAKTDIGKKYEHNEDRYILPDNIKKTIFKKNGYLFCMCDGMGGVNAGEVAAELSCNWIHKAYYEQKVSKKSNIKTLLKDIVLSTNEKIINLAKEYKQYEGMGCTLVSALFMKDKLHVVNLGDSRMYLYAKDELKQLTEDQSEVWELYKMGAIEKDDIRKHPRNHIITQAIGVDKDLKAESINYFEYKTYKKGLYLICSDGLTDMVSEADIRTMLSKKDSLDEKGDALIQAANDAGGKDNITVLLIQAE